MIVKHRQLGGWTEDAQKAIVDNPTYFVWWYSVKSWLLVGTSIGLAYMIGRSRK